MTRLEAARRELAALGDEEVLADPLALRLYARDASIVEGRRVSSRSPGPWRTSSCVRIAAAHDLDVVPRGSGTGLTGASTPLGDALVVVTSKMDRILEIRPEDRLAWVEPGLFNLDLGTALPAGTPAVRPCPA